MSDIAEAIKNLTRTLDRRVIEARESRRGMDEKEKKEVAEAMSEMVSTFNRLGLSEKEDGRGN